MSQVTKSYRAPFGRGLLIGAAVSAVLWAAFGAVVFWVAALV